MSAADSARWIESYRATMTAKSNAELDSTETIDHFAPPSPQHTFAVSPYTSRQPSPSLRSSSKLFESLPSRSNRHSPLRQSLPLQRALPLPRLNTSSAAPGDTRTDRRHRLYIGNVAAATAERDLAELLLEKGCGPLDQLAISRNNHSHFAFTNLSSDDKVQRAISLLHGFVLLGQPLIVERSADGGSRLEVARSCPYRLFFGNLASWTTLEELQKFVVAVEPSAWGFSLHQASTGRFAFANVESMPLLERVIRILDKSTMHGCTIKVMKAEGGSGGPSRRSLSIEEHGAGARSSTHDGRYARAWSKDNFSYRDSTPRPPLPPRRRSSRSRSRSRSRPPPRPRLQHVEIASSELFCHRQQPTLDREDVHRPTQPVSSVNMDKDRLSTLNLSIADLGSIETLWTPISPPPSPTFSRTISVSTTFGYLSPSDAADALKLPPPSFVAEEPGRQERYEGWLKSQMGEKGRYIAMLGQVACFSTWQAEFGSRGKEDAEELLHLSDV